MIIDLKSSAASFVENAEPETHLPLLKGYVTTLPMSEGASQDDLASAAAGFIDRLGVVLAGMPPSNTPTVRRGLAQGVALELEQIITDLLADHRRSHCLGIILREVVP